MRRWVWSQGVDSLGFMVTRNKGYQLETKVRNNCRCSLVKRDERCVLVARVAHILHKQIFNVIDPVVPEIPVAAQGGAAHFALLTNSLHAESVLGRLFVSAVPILALSA